MKFLRNPAVVGLLAVLAVGLVFYQAIWPMLKRGRGSVPQRVNAVAAQVVNKAGAAIGLAPQTAPAAQARGVICPVIRMPCCAAFLISRPRSRM